MKRYSLNACEKLIDKYVNEHKGFITRIDEGVLGLGTVVLHGENLKTIIIKEMFVDEWNCAHTIRKYNKMPKKYENLIYVHEV